MAKNEKRKLSGPEMYPSEDTPFIFFDETSPISSNRDIVRLYLLRDRPSLSVDSDETTPVTVAELGMGLRTFALVALEFHAVLTSMMTRGIFSADEIKEFREALSIAKRDPRGLVEEASQKNKR